jgi:spore coat protein H
MKIVPKLAAIVLLVPAIASAQEKKADKVELFGMTRLWTYHLEISAKDWKAMQPTKDGKPFEPMKEPFKKPKDGKMPPKKGPPVKFEFDYVHGQLDIDGTKFKNVAVRFKGNSSYNASAFGLKRPFKFDFNDFVEDQSWHGLKKISLANNMADNTQMRETFAYRLFHDLGVPAPRTAFVQLSLTVPGKYDKEFVGLYTMIECVDSHFLKDRFGSAKGMLLKPEKVRPLEYLGEDWTKYEERYQPKTNASRKQQRRLYEFLKLVNQATDERFKKEIGDYLDVDEFTRFLAVNAVVANLDSFLTVGHNFYLYLHPTTNKFVFIPWDLNHAYGGFPPTGSPEKQMELSITHPYSGKNPLIDRLLGIKEVREQYLGHVKTLMKQSFTIERTMKDEAVAGKVIGNVIERERNAAIARGDEGPFGKKMFGPKGTSLLPLVEKRIESIEAQLAGKREGYIPEMPKFDKKPPKDFN